MECLRLRIKDIDFDYQQIANHRRHSEHSPPEEDYFLIRLFQVYNVGNINFQHFDAGRNPNDISGNGWKIFPGHGKILGGSFHHLDFSINLGKVSQPQISISYRKLVFNLS